jgi:hypothetical protein
LHFFFFNLEGGGFIGGYFSVFLVPIMFPISYYHVFNLFPKFSMYSPTCFPYHLTWNSYVLAHVVLLSHI